MQETRLMMGMPITVAIVDLRTPATVEAVFDYFDAIDRRFSTYRDDSEVALINTGRLDAGDYSNDMRAILSLAERIQGETGGYFDIRRQRGGIDPSGVVKGWAIRNAAGIIRSSGAQRYFIDAGGDIQSHGTNADGRAWRVGIRNPFNHDEIIKVVRPDGRGIATSGTYVRGQHIHDPHRRGATIDDPVSLTVIGPNVLDADLFATAAFAMGPAGIRFIEGTPGLEGYAVWRNRTATMTSGFQRFVVQ
jgi:thiamine biosynthesis lipoprotein